ncbi:MAG: glycosyltransferase family 9 protein [Bacteroidales bacterium]|nr:glycosyltransferase family 9 protein [Bacteroidales bacterium]
MKKILIIQTAFIGDVILATSLSASLKAYDEKFIIDFFVPKSCTTVLQEHPHIRNVISWDKSSKYKNLFALIHVVRKERYDLVVNVHRFGSSGFLTVRSGARKTVGFKKNPLSFLFSKRVEHSFDCHEIERNHLLIKVLFPDIKLQNPYISAENVDFSSYGIHENYITIAPGSVWKTKRYPIEKWKKFIDEIPFDIQIIAIGSKEDSTLAENIFTNGKQNQLNLCGKLSLRQSAYVMKHAKMNYANDSAPTHLASAVNAPISTVFCSTLPAFGFTPLSSDSHIIEYDGELDCRPCGIHGHRTCPEKHFKCGNEIKTEQLLKVLKV